jgi:cellulose synthase/poly-beta-1,6-N-acetylglucosamine synthase-like glycosyltransferase
MLRHLGSTVIDSVPYAFAVLLVTVIALQALVYVSATIELRRVRQRDRHQLWRRMLSSPFSPRVSILIPAYGEELTIAESVSSILALTYPNLEVVVVNDGSKDATLERLIEHFQLSAIHPVVQKVVPTADILGVYRSETEARLVVVDKLNGGKADALNTGLNVACGDLVCAVDADTLVAPDALQQLIAPFLNEPETVAVGGTVRLTNGSNVARGKVDQMQVPTNLLAGIQTVEYIRSFLVGRLGWNPLGGTLIVSGAFGLFRRSTLLEVRGYEHASIGEDMELVVRLRRHGYETGEPNKVVFTADPVAWTEAPESLRVLARQRNRWFRGLLDVLNRHRRMMFNPRYGVVGTISLPYFLLVEALAPVLEAIGLTVTVIGFAAGRYGMTEVALIGSTILSGMALTIGILIVDDLGFHSYRGVLPRTRLVLFAIVEQLFFRPMTLVWRLWGLRLYLQGRTEWGVQVRQGFSKS